MSFIQKKAVIKRHLIDMVKRFQTAVNDRLDKIYVRLDKIMASGGVDCSKRNSNGYVMTYKEIVIAHVDHWKKNRSK